MTTAVPEQVPGPQVVHRHPVGAAVEHPGEGADGVDSDQPRVP